MVDIETLRKNYKKIVLWGYIPSIINKYHKYLDKNEDYIVDMDIKKQGSEYLGFSIKSPQVIFSEGVKDTTIIILSKANDIRIYSDIRLKGIKCDVYSHDMVVFDKQYDSKYYFSNGKYTSEKHIQVLIFLLKAYNIRKIIVSPGTVNISFIYSVQSDPFFEIYSCVDERSAAYMACGIAQTTGEVVVLSCTGATASRNYMSGLTEAFYSRLPVLAITSSQKSYKIGNEIEQITDRTKLPADIVKMSIEIDTVRNWEEREYCELKINKALSCLNTGIRGPVHINLITDFTCDFSIKTLPKCRVVQIINNKNFPVLKGRIAIYIKTYSEKWSTYLINLINEFCAYYDAVVLGDHLSNYTGKYFIQAPLLFRQEKVSEKFDIVICLGEINYRLTIPTKEVWRVSISEQIVDPDLKLTNYFRHSYIDFFTRYVDIAKQQNYVLSENNYNILKGKYISLLESIPELCYSNMWIAQNTISRIPKFSIIYYGISSSLRIWNYFEIDRSIKCYSTVGGFGIDGTLSAMMGSSIVYKDRLHFIFIGDLSFFYDMNILGNRHIGNNVRIMVFNNNGGNQMLYQNGIDDKELVLDYIAASGHYNSIGYSPIQAYSESLGFMYISASNKEEYLKQLPQFLSTVSENSIIFEVFYDSENDVKTQNIITNLEQD